MSDTVSSSLRLSRTQRVELEAEAIERFRARTSVEDVASVAVSFTNARILEADDSEIFRLIHNRTEPCANAINARQAAGFEVTMVSSSFIADVTYDVSFNRSVRMDKSVAEDKMAEIAGKLGGGHTEVTDHSIKAVNLVLGVRTETFLMSILPDLAQLPLRTGEFDKLPGPIIESDNNADAPLIAPAGNGWVSPVRGP